MSTYYDGNTKSYLPTFRETSAFRSNVERTAELGLLIGKAVLVRKDDGTPEYVGTVASITLGIHVLVNMRNPGLTINVDDVPSRVFFATRFTFEELEG